MPDYITLSSESQRRAATGAGLLTATGFAAGFGLASCCALPMTFATLGFGAAWFGSIATLAAPHRTILMLVAVACLLGGSVLLWQQQRRAATCGPNGVCTPPAVRMLTAVGLLMGSVLLWAGYTYA